MKYVFLSQAFYDEYKDCGEIEQKPNRPYVCILTQIDGLTFAVPLRSKITHKNALLTDKEEKHGVDFSKAVILTDPEKYIDTSISPHIRQDEFNYLRGKEFIIETRMRKYIKEYKKAITNLDVERNQRMIGYSTLQYFHKELGIDQPEQFEDDN